MLKIPPRQCGVRSFSNGLQIKVSIKLLVEDTGGDVWRGAIALSKYLSEDVPHAIQGKGVLDLASGTGLLGLSLALSPASAGSVLLTDQEFMVGLLAENVCTNEGVLREGCVRAAALDFGVDDLDPLVLEGAPFDVIVMSDVFYDEDIVEPLINTLRRLCALSLKDDRYPDMYLCASHRTERIEGMFFSSVRHFFDCDDVTGESRMLPELRREFIGIWRLRVRGGLAASALLEGLGVGKDLQAALAQRGVLDAVETGGGHVLGDAAVGGAGAERECAADGTVAHAATRLTHPEQAASQRGQPGGLGDGGQQDEAGQPRLGCEADDAQPAPGLPPDTAGDIETCRDRDHHRGTPPGQGACAQSGVREGGSIDLEELD